MTENFYSKDEVWNEGHAVGKVKGWNEAIKKVRAVLGALPVWDDDILWLKVDKKLEALVKKVSE